MFFFHKVVQTCSSLYNTVNQVRQCLFLGCTPFSHVVKTGGRERERERERQAGRRADTERDRDRETETVTETERQTETDRQTDRQRGGDICYRIIYSDAARRILIV